MTTLVIAATLGIICAAFADSHYRADRWFGFFIWAMGAFIWGGAAMILFRAAVVS